MTLNQDNIVAVATATGYAGIGVVRVSGHNLLEIVTQISHKNNLKPRVASYTDFYNIDNEVIDSGLIIYFSAPYSFTGEDVIELQGHGSPIVLQMILKRCLELGCRIAQPGEFSRRAYLNGKIDLVQAESIVDLIHAESEMAARGALKSLKGTFSKHIDTINQQLINLRMFVEATLDFPEEDIEFIVEAKIQDKLRLLQTSIGGLLANTKQGVLLNNGANIVIVGRPNVGKSSLLNALANEEVAIVTAVAGTTRDIVKEKIIINGVVFNLIDTAGIRDTEDIVEKIGIERALHAVQNAELCLVLIDDSIGITPEDELILAKIPTELPRLFVHNKIDITNSNPRIDSNSGVSNIYISAKQQLGLGLLRDEILKLVGFDNSCNNVFIARTRHLEAMKQAVSHIDNAFANWHQLELIAEELRYAHNNLTDITGEFTSDDLLGEIFSKFCIGK
jgi:tRNA modification GTPase